MVQARAEVSARSYGSQEPNIALSMHLSVCVHSEVLTFQLGLEGGEVPQMAKGHRSYSHSFSKP